MPGIIGWIVGGYIGVLVLLFAAQRSLLYHPTKAVPVPSQFGVAEMQVVQVPTGESLKLYCWWRPPARDDRATVIYFHGNAGHIGDRAFKVRPLLNQGYGVLLVSYRYNADTGGKPTEEGLYEDGHAAYAFVRSHDIPADRIVIYGESLGSGIATELASSQPVGAVVLEAPYTSIPDVAQTHYWYTPARWLLLDRFNSVKRIDKIDAPVLIVHGEADSMIPVKLARELFAAATEPKEVRYIPGGGHADLYDFGVDQMISDFLARSLKS